MHQRDNVVYWKTNGKINNDLQSCIYTCICIHTCTHIHTHTHTTLYTCANAHCHRSTATKRTARARLECSRSTPTCRLPARHTPTSVILPSYVLYRFSNANGLILATVLASLLALPFCDMRPAPQQHADVLSHASCAISYQQDPHSPPCLCRGMPVENKGACAETLKRQLYWHVKCKFGNKLRVLPSLFFCERAPARSAEIGVSFVDGFGCAVYSGVSKGGMAGSASFCGDC